MTQPRGGLGREKAACGLHHGSCRAPTESAGVLHLRDLPCQGELDMGVA